MEIHKNTWHYKLWKLTHLSRDVPEKTSLCRYVWRLLLMPIPTALKVILYGVAFLTLAIIAVAFLLVVNACTILSGMGYVMPSDEESEGDCPVGYTPFPPLKLGNHQLSIAGIVWSIYGTAMLIASWMRFHQQITSAAAAAIGYVLPVVAVGFGLALVVIIILAWRQTETWQLIKAVTKAKKDKVCPLVVFKG